MTNEKSIIELRDEALAHLKNKMDGYALGGGTALSLVYFKHRESYDLDFFTKQFDERQIKERMSKFGAIMKKKVRVRSKFASPGKASVIRFEVGAGLKIDFIEDQFRNFNGHSMWNGIPVLSQESIYLRKIYATCGIAEGLSDTGRRVAVGGRQEAKDYFDLYYLSTVAIPLSSFVRKYCDMAETERVVAWFNRFDHMRMVEGLLELRTNQEPDVKEMKKHFNSEIQMIILRQLD